MHAFINCTATPFSIVYSIEITNTDINNDAIELGSFKRKKLAHTICHLTCNPNSFNPLENVCDGIQWPKRKYQINLFELNYEY